MKNLYRVTLVVDVPAENEVEAIETCRAAIDLSPTIESGGEFSAEISPEDAEYKAWMQELSEIPRGEAKPLIVGRGHSLSALMAVVAAMGGDTGNTLVLRSSEDEPTPRIVLKQDTPESGVDRSVIPPKLFRRGR